MGKLIQVNGVDIEEVALGGTTDSGGNAAGRVVATGFGLKGAAHNRNIAAAATTHPADGSNNVATFTAAENIREITINAVGGVAAALQNDEAYLVVINAPSNATALAWLTAAGGAAQDVMYEVGYPSQPLVIQRTAAITQVDVLPLTIAMRIIISGVGV